MLSFAYYSTRSGFAGCVFRRGLNTRIISLRGSSVSPSISLKKQKMMEEPSIQGSTRRADQHMEP